MLLQIKISALCAFKGYTGQRCTKVIQSATEGCFKVIERFLLFLVDAPQSEPVENSTTAPPKQTHENSTTVPQHHLHMVRDQVMRQINYLEVGGSY